MHISTDDIDLVNDQLFTLYSQIQSEYIDNKQIKQLDMLVKKWIYYKINQSIKAIRYAYVGIKLTNKARKIVVLKLFGEQINGKLVRIPNYKTSPRAAP